MKKIILSILAISFISCATHNQIVRWPNGSEEQQSRSLEMVENDNIFNDFLWTTPPLSSRRIENNFIFNNEEYSFSVSNKILTLINNGNTFTYNLTNSSDTIYPNTEFLEPTTRFVNKWVPKTTTKVDTVPVTKTRTVPVTTYGANGTPSTSFQTEVYTDFETRFVTQTNWVWEPQTEFSYNIPTFEYYDVEIGEDIHFFIYKIDNEYYLQNPQYIMCREMNKTFWGEKEINIIFVDSNANGVYLEKEDHVLFNTWNPYDSNSSYRTISYLMDNKWYYTDILENELFMSFTIDNGSIIISYLNEEYIGTERVGYLTVNGIEDLDSDISINGQKYRIKDGKPFKSELGKFNIKISVENHLDYLNSFTIDETNPENVIDYELTDNATLLKINNIFSNNYFVTISNNIYTKTYYNLKEINIPIGENTIEINVNGFSLIKEVNSNDSSVIEIDFEDEIKKI